MNAAPETQLQLLDLQALDSTLDRLAHRRRTLPELALIDELQARLATLGDQIIATQTEDSDLGREQTKLENDVDLVRTRSARDQGRLDSGQVASPKELENLQSEVASLARRQADLEDQVLELMERRENVQTRLSELTATRDAAAAELGSAQERRDAAFAEIDAEASTTAQHRKELAGSLPADLVALYEKVREAQGGVGAAALHRGRCEGCHLHLNTVELARLHDAPADTVLRCEECRRILVRTPESGL